MQKRTGREPIIEKCDIDKYENELIRHMTPSQAKERKKNRIQELEQSLSDLTRRIAEIKAEIVEWESI